MEKKTRHYHWILRLMCASILMTGLAACGSSEGSDDPDTPDKPKPDVPVAEGDWQVVPATGGTITKDSLSITFPSGTFTEDAKVAITEVQKGKTCGSYEASAFYQITMPCTASKPITFKIRNKEKNDDITFVTHSKACCTSQLSEKEVELPYDTNYSNGEYTATMPAINGGLEGENVYFTAGLVHQVSYPYGRVRTRSPYEAVIREGKVKNIAYKLRFSNWTIRTYKEKWDSLMMVERKAPKVEEYVKQALTKILDLGINLEGDKILYIDFDKDSKGYWGGHVVNGFPGSSGWSMWVTLGIQRLLDERTTETDIKSTVIHEIFHWFQTFYDPRYNITKAYSTLLADEEMVTYEMGAVWIESLMNDGKLNASFVNQHLEPLIYDELTIDPQVARTTKGNQSKSKKEIYQNLGYSMAPLLYYICSVPEMNEYNLSNKSVVELHEIWGKNITATLDNLKKWTWTNHNFGVLVGDGIDAYYLSLLRGELTEDIHVGAIVKHGANHRIYNNEFGDTIFKGKCFPYGCAVRRINLKNFGDKSLIDKEIVFKHETEGTHTYLLMTEKDTRNKKYRTYSKVMEQGDSIVISGEQLESYRPKDGKFDNIFWLVTTRTTNDLNDHETKEWSISFDFKDSATEPKQATVNPKTISFDVYGGYNYDVKIDKGSYKYCDVEVPSIFSTWLKASVTNDGKVTIIAEPNETTENRQGTVNCWVSTKPNPTDAEKKYLTPSVTVIQQGGVENTGNASVEPTTLDFPAVGGSKNVAFDYGAYSYYGKTLSDAALEWIRTDWSIDYLDVIGYSSTNRFAKQFYVNVFPNPSNTERVDTVKMSFYYTKGAPWNERYVVPVIIRQDAGPATLADMKKLFVGKWWSKYDKTSAGNDKYNYQRYTFNADNTFAHETSIAIDGILPPTWDMEKSGTYSITSYKVLGHRVQLQIQLQVKEGYYNCIVEVFPHFMYLAYYNNAGMLVHGVYLEKI